MPGDDAWLLSRLPAPAGEPRDAAGAGPAAGGAPTAPRDDPATARRSDDDSDVGWGRQEESGNDDRLRRDRPPHW